MKKRTVYAATALVLCASLTLPSCIGSFGLTNKLLTWNRSLSSKFVNELVFFAFWIVPVYEVSALADILVINSIEFWSGDNPVACKGKKVVEGEHGKCLVECDGKGYTVTNLRDRSVVRFDYDKASNGWNMTVGDKTVTLFTFIDDTHVSMLQPDGSYAPVELSNDGVQAYLTSSGSDRLMAFAN